MLFRSMGARGLAAPVFVPFTAQTRMSGVDVAQGNMVRSVRKGAADAVRRYVTERAGKFPEAVMQAVDDVARAGSTPLVVAEALSEGTEDSVRVLLAREARMVRVVPGGGRTLALSNDGTRLAWSDGGTGRKIGRAHV